MRPPPRHTRLAGTAAILGAALLFGIACGGSSSDGESIPFREVPFYPWSLDFGAPHDLFVAHSEADVEDLLVRLFRPTADSPLDEGWAAVARGRFDGRRNVVVAFLPSRCPDCHVPEGKVVARAKDVRLSGTSGVLTIRWEPRCCPGDDDVPWDAVIVALPREELPAGVKWEVRDGDDRLLAREDQ